MIIRKVQAAKWYAVIANEVTDVSNKKQLSIMLRYVDCDSLMVREDLVAFTECDTGISGKNLADKITCSLEGLGLDLSNLHGQAYDGAGNRHCSNNNITVSTSNLFALCFTLSQPCSCQVIGSNKYQKHDGCRWESVPFLCCTPKTSESRYF